MPWDSIRGVSGERTIRLIVQHDCPWAMDHRECQPIPGKGSVMCRRWSRHSRYGAAQRCAVHHPIVEEYRPGIFGLIRNYGLRSRPQVLAIEERCRDTARQAVMSFPKGRSIPRSTSPSVLLRARNRNIEILCRDLNTAIGRVCRFLHTAPSPLIKLSAQRSYLPFSHMKGT